MLKRSALRRLLPAGLVTGVVTLALLLPAGPLAAELASFGYSYGGTLRTSPGVSSGSDVSEDVFFGGTDRQLYQTHWDGTSFGGFVAHGGVLNSNPGTV